MFSGSGARSRKLKLLRINGLGACELDNTEKVCAAITAGAALFMSGIGTSQPERSFTAGDESNRQFNIATTLHAT